MKRIIVTGASGFIGANLVRRLLRDGHELHLLVRKSYRRWRLDEISDRVQFHEVHLEDPEAVKRVIRDIRPQWVFNLAAYGAYSSQTGFKQMLEVNTTACAELVDACAAVDVEAFVQAGSSSEYGFKNHAPMENEVVRPNSPYAVSKVTATLYCQMAAQSSGLNTSILRLYSIYGPYEEPTRLIPVLVTHGLENKLPPLVSPKIARDFVHVDDAVEAMVMIAELTPSRPGSIYNICSGIQSDVGSVVAIVRRLLSVRVEPVWNNMMARSWDTETWVGSPVRTAREVGWCSRLSLEDGLRLTIDWFKGNPKWLQFYRKQCGM